MLLPHTDLIATTKKTAHENWQTLYTESINNKGKFYGSIQAKIPQKPWFDKITNTRKLIITLTRIRLNHANTPKFQHRIGQIASPHCSCDNKSIADIRHLIMECKKYETQRSELLNSLKKNNINIENNYKSLITNKETYKHIMKFVNECDLNL